ncbi:MAG: hypothetical protein HKN23_00805, partial [Verrucomicrobiales bacterium]|nr:hypothetical protein [Verrucomicrobiales bacterium]
MIFRILVFVAPFAIIALSLFFFQNPNTPVVIVETPIAGVDFTDGYRFEILEAVDSP